jgi:predicted NBD/HSP70 family sugar kinase
MVPIAVSTASSAQRGSSQAGMRAHNERIVLSLIRLHRQIHRVDLARLTGLSTQTISIITNQLTEDGLLLRGEPQRGRIGQPSVPYSLNPEGALAFGVKVGRRSVDLYLIDFVGNVLEAFHQTYDYPTVQTIRDFTAAGLDKILTGLSPALIKRIAGVGIAAPYEIWTWHEEIGAPQEELDRWRTVDLRSEIASLCRWPVYFANDITAACAAEFMFGIGGDFIDYLYVYIGSFIGGGLVLNGHLFPGRTENAGALGSMPAHAKGSSSTRGHVQLMNVASIYVLERKLKALGRDPSFLWRSPDEWGDDLGPALEEWIGELAEAVAYAIVSAVAVIDVETVIVDGAFPRSVRWRIVESIRAAIARVAQQGLSHFSIIEGSIGNAARAMGGASLPLLANFTQDREVLFRDDPTLARGPNPHVLTRGS